MPKVPELSSLKYVQKNMGDEVYFLLAEKDESFLQVGSIALS